MHLSLFSFLLSPILTFLRSIGETTISEITSQSQCTSFPPSSISITTSSTLKKQFILTFSTLTFPISKFEYQCDTSNKCSTSMKATRSGDHYLITAVSVNGADTLSFELLKITINLDPLDGYTQNTLQTVTKFISTPIKIRVNNEITNENCPTFYYDSNDSSKQLTNCNVLCHYAYCQMPYNVQSGSFTIYYDEPCGSKKSSGISVTINVGTAEVTQISFLDDETCSLSKIGSKFIKLTTQNDIEGKISNVILQRTSDSDTITYSSCYIETSTTIICSNPSKFVSSGTYSIYQINGDYIFLFSSVNTLEVTTLAIQTAEQIATTEESVIFYVNTSQMVKVYLSKEDAENNLNEVECSKDSDGLTLICSSGTISNGEYDIYVSGECGGKDLIGDTGIKVTKTDESIVEITSIKVDNCSDEYTMQFTLTATSFSGTTAQAIVGRKDDYSIYEYTCSGWSSQITCKTTTALKDGTYYLKYFGDTGDLSKIYKSNSITIDTSSIPFGQQINTQPIITLTNPTFDVVLKPGKAQPEIFFELMNKERINCIQSGDILTCTPNSSTLDNMMDGFNIPLQYTNVIKMFL